MTRRILDALYVELSARPMFALTLGFLGASFAYGYVTEAARLRRIAAETETALSARADEIRSHIPAMYAGENSAEWTPERWRNDGEIAERIG